jgi:hypothetical protein
MEIVKAISSFIPFLAPCPTWVKFLVAAWIVCTGIIIAIVVFVRLLLPEPDPCEDPNCPTPSLSITTPPDQSIVSQYVTIEGTTNLKTLSHYIVISTQNHEVWVTDGPLLIGTEKGHWTGHAQLGTPTQGPGQTFLIYVVATRNPLELGQTTMKAIYSVASGTAAITVHRN